MISAWFDNIHFIFMEKEQPIQKFIEAHSELQTPYYLVDETRLVANMQKIAYVREKSGAKLLLALKCFATWSVFPLMSQYMDGTTSSSLYEAQLGHEKFGKETHAYSVAYTQEEVRAVRNFATKIIFNSTSQLMSYYDIAKGVPIGLRINPGFSYSRFDLADPARKCCRLGVRKEEDLKKIVDQISGVMFHNQCDNDDVEAFSKNVDRIGERYSWLLEKMEWVSLGGGIYFTKKGYPLDKFCDILKNFSQEHNVQVYLEPGESAVTNAGYLVTQVLDIVHNEIDIAIVDAAVESHMLDVLIYQIPAKVDLEQGVEHRYQIAGRTCLAGDIFGTYNFSDRLHVGSLIPFSDAIGYTMVKKNWFNGIQMPSIVVLRADGRVEVIKRFEYEDYLQSLS